MVSKLIDLAQLVEHAVYDTREQTERDLLEADIRVDKGGSKSLQIKLTIFWRL